MKQHSASFNKRLFFLVTVSFLLITTLSACKLIPETDLDRGGTIVSQDPFGDSYTSIKYLDQGWNIADSMWFYNTTQGSNLMPYDFFMVLEKEDGQLFRSNENMNYYRYLIRKPGSGNPDGLPVGWVKDDYKGQEYIGLTCAACHTGQINYNGIAVRIDGGPAMADMGTIMLDLAMALNRTRKDEGVKNRFVKNVMARGNYKSESAVIEDLDRHALRIASYVSINYTDVPYGYARLDAFGRIYNRVLEHLINGRVLKELFHEKRVLSDSDFTEADIDKIIRDNDDAMTGKKRDSMLANLVERLDARQLGHLRLALFNHPNAPVSYPFLWDIPQHDYVQWNGLAANAGLGPVGRNTGEVIGVFGTLDWKEEKGITLSSIIGGQTTGVTRTRFESSVNVHNLHRIESHLTDLTSPAWPEDVLGEIDWDSANHGREIFNQYCVSCHARILPKDPERRVVAQMSKLEAVGTDPAMAQNSTLYQGFTGILRNQYVDVGVGSILLDHKAPVAALLTKATLNVVATPDPDKMFFQRWGDFIWDNVSALLRNEIKSSIKQGNYVPDTTAVPFASLEAYKARPLNGIWATAPYLHNGSVPTLYDLLLPKKRDGDPDDGEYRPDEFQVGSREFDPKKVGFRTTGYQGFTFKTHDKEGKEIRGNSNAGHEYASGKTAQPDGKILPALSEKQRWDLLEYLKTL